MTPRPIRLLITARDVAAALHLVQVAKAGLRDSRFEIHVAVQDPAAAHFAGAGVAAERLQLPPARQADAPEAIALRQAARDLLARVKPDVILVGLSTPFDAGLDEAVLAEATVPTALFQDFWGEQNLVLGRPAGLLLALDAEAVSRNLARYDRTSTIVGSARHSAYAALDIAAARPRARARLELAGGAQVVGFFGQALHQLEGYARTVARFLDAVGGLSSPVRLLLRPHPRENDAQRRETERLFGTTGLPVTLQSDGSVEEALLACDVVVSLFSTCTYDTAYLNRFSSTPIAVPVSLLFDPEIAEYCRQHGNFVEFAHHTLGLVKPVYELDELKPTLESALRPGACETVWARAHDHLPDPADAPARVLDALAAQVRLFRSVADAR